MPYDDSLAYLSATEARAAMQAKTLSPAELLRRTGAPATCTIWRTGRRGAGRG